MGYKPTIPRPLTAVMLMCSLCFSLQCQTEKDKQNEQARIRVWRGEQAVQGRNSWHEKLDPRILHESPQMAKRIVGMSAEEKYHRLGSFKEHLTASYSFNKGLRRYAQLSDIALHQDSSGNFHVKQDTEKTIAEIYYLDKTLYVKLDNGPYRKKEALNQIVSRWRELISQSQMSVFELIEEHVALQKPELSSYAKRTVYRYDIEMKEPGNKQQDIQPPEDANSDFNWKELWVPTDITGQLIVDGETSAPLRLSIKAQADIRDRPVQSSTMRIKYDNATKEIMDTAAVQAPEKIVPEHERLHIHRPDITKYVPSYVDAITDEVL